ncbi:hypothetical protein ACH5RR_026563 [Cinchona calisaya]|uniref:SWIM-type domain-containing protein n=1 Tax=Cinchona calisaya TaxID=153742 RepID=A0ABD2Z2X7_9GENT
MVLLRGVDSKSWVIKGFGYHSLRRREKWELNAYIEVNMNHNAGNRNNAGNEMNIGNVNIHERSKSGGNTNRTSGIKTRGSTSKVLKNTRISKSDDDEMSVCCGDELFLTYVTEELKAKSDSSGDLSGYESNSYVEVENESDSDIEADLMGAYLNSIEFTISDGERFRLLKGMIFADVDAFRKVLYEYNIQWGFSLIRDKNEKRRVTAHYGNYGREWRVQASPMPDDSNVSTNVLRNELTKYGLSPSDMLLYIAKQKAIDIIDGSHAEGYNLLPKYCIMLMNTNSSSKVPWAINRKCCRHILSNFKGKFPGALLTQLFWQAARSYHEKNFKEAVVKIKALKLEAYEWLDKILAELWARHAFPIDLKNAYITNNIAESFNNWLEILGNKVVPHVRKKLNEIANECRKCTLLFANGNEFQVNECNVSYIVNINERTYNCKVWNLTRIPCKHAVAILINKRVDLESYCEYSLTNDFYFKAYNAVIHPILDVQFWPPIEVNPSKVLPLVLKRKAGRSKKARRRELGEALVVGHIKRSSTLKCSLCQQFGHNKRERKDNHLLQLLLQHLVIRPHKSHSLFLLKAYDHQFKTLSLFFQAALNIRPGSLSQTPEQMFGSSVEYRLLGKELASMVMRNTTVKGYGKLGEGKLAEASGKNS